MRFLLQCKSYGGLRLGRMKRQQVCVFTREPSEDHKDDHDDDCEADKVGHVCVGCCLVEVVGFGVRVEGV